jgi:ribosomal protein S18 acetylase RimI-like enzyme
MPAAPFRVRPARPGDLPALAAMGAKLARQHHTFDPARFFLPEEPIEDGYAWWLGKELARKEVVILAAVRTRDRAVVGYAYGRVEPRDWNALRDVAGVGVDLWVEPAARRHGAGAALVEALIAALAGRGVDQIVLGVAARNRLARQVFRGLGFREVMVELARPARAAAGAPAAPAKPRRRRVPAGRATPVDRKRRVR